MDRLTAIPLRIGAWRVDPRTGQLTREGETVRVEARTLRLLLYLAQRAGEVVSQDELLEQVWSGVVVTPDSVYQAVASLRRTLGDDPKRPTYIATVPRLGYRMVASVGPWVEEAQELELAVSMSPRSTGVAKPSEAIAPHGCMPPPLVPPSIAVSGPPDTMVPLHATRRASRAASKGRRRLVILAALGFLVLFALLLLFVRIPTHAILLYMPGDPPARSVAVLPFLDLTTESMNEEYFADGMTEELIDQLAKIPDLRVPPPTSSFYFKGKQVTVTGIARSLDVAYVLDGSVRKSGTTLRISARLVRAADGYVVWSETYDRPEGDKLWVQEDIASQVAKALPAAIR